VVSNPYHGVGARVRLGGAPQHQPDGDGGAQPLGVAPQVVEFEAANFLKPGYHIYRFKGWVTRRFQALWVNWNQAAVQLPALATAVAFSASPLVAATL
jgi:hypothetical protein